MVRRTTIASGKHNGLNEAEALGVLAAAEVPDTGCR